MGGVFVKKKCKNEGVFFVKKWTFPQRMMHYVQYQYFFILHFTYFGDAYTPNTPHPLPADDKLVSNQISQRNFKPFHKSIFDPLDKLQFFYFYACCFIAKFV